MKELGYKTFTGEESESIKPNDIMNYEEGVVIYDNPEDSLKNTTLDDEKKIVLVEGIGDFYSFNSDYYGYDNMRMFKTIKVVKILTEKEIIERVNIINDFSAIRIIRDYRLPEEVKKSLSAKSEYLCDAINYYQNGKKDAFEQREKAKVKKYGQNYNKGCTRK